MKSSIIDSIRHIEGIIARFRAGDKISRGIDMNVWSDNSIVPDWGSDIPVCVKNDFKCKKCVCSPCGYDKYTDEPSLETAVAWRDSLRTALERMEL